MALQQLVENSQLFFLVFARIYAIVQVAPLLSSQTIPQMAKTGLSLLAAVAVFPNMMEIGYIIPDYGLVYAFMLIGELLLGLTMGFFLVIIYSAFQIAGQLFSLQMGFGASQVFDPLAQVQIPLIGQFLNMVAMFVFVTVNGFQKIFIVGVYRSFQYVKASDFMQHTNYVADMMLAGFSGMFRQALLISFPILGTLLLVSTTMGLLAKAAPQMNLLMLGFPIAIMVAFFMIFITMPFIIELFSKLIDHSFEQILMMLDHVWTEASNGNA